MTLTFVLWYAHYTHYSLDELTFLCEKDLFCCYHIMQVSFFYHVLWNQPETETYSRKKF